MYVEVTVGENTVIRHYCVSARCAAMLRDAFEANGYECEIGTEEVDTEDTDNADAIEEN